VKLIDLCHELCVLAGKADWNALELQLGGLYAAGVGRSVHSIGLMVGLQAFARFLKPAQENR
jgi:hypothetical protein